MKIAIFIRSLNKGGAENQAIYICKQLLSKFTTKLIVLHGEGDLIPKVFEILPNDCIELVRGKNYISKLYSLYCYFKSEKFDYLFCLLPSNNILGIIIGRLVGIKFIFGGIRGTKLNKNWIKVYLQKFLFNNLANGVVLNSHKATQVYSDFGLNKEKMYVIQNAIEINQEFKVRPEKKITNILSVGRFVSEKDYDTAIASINELISKNKNISYTIVGYGNLETHIRNLIGKYKLDHHIELVINPDNLDYYYQNADIFLLTSIYEGMPNTVMEAMTHSLPIVATNVGDVSHLVSDGFNGYLCKTKDFYEISERVMELVNDYNKRISFGSNSYTIIKEKFSLDRLKDDYIRLIQQNQVIK